MLDALDEHMDTALRVAEPFWHALSDRYSLERELGRGGMATVFLATDLRNRRRVAIKVLRPELSSALGTARFLREIDIVSTLAHPSLVPLFESGEAEGELYYVMPFIDGETLRARLRRERRLSLDEAVRITLDVAGGLSYAHERGIVHRDIKPENVLLQEDRALVGDFGIARAITMSAQELLTSSGIVIGTAAYMSPEQAAGERELDARSDVYSLGCVLYEMLAGEPPFTGSTVQAVIARQISERPPSLRVVRPDLPKDIEGVIRRALSKTPADRYASVSDFAEAVRACATAPQRSPWRAKRLTVLSSVAALLLIGAFVAAKSAHSGALRYQDWLLVADFDGPSDDPQLAAAVRDLVTQTLKETQYVRVVDRRRLNDVMRNAGIPETTHVDAARARELAVRSSVRAILRGSVRRLDTATYEIVLHVIGAESGKSLVSLVSAAPEQGLTSAAEALARELRARLGESRGALSANRPMRIVATPSFAAFRLYSAAADALEMRGDIAASTGLLQRAVRLDSGFAIAWSYLASNYLNARQIDSARTAYQHALAHADRLSIADQYRLKGDVAYTIDHDVPSAVKWYDLYLAEAPTSSSGRMNRGFYLAALGEYAKSLADFEQAVTLSPFGPEVLQPELNNEAAVLVSLGRVPEAQAITRKLSGPFAQLMDVMIPAAESKWSLAESAAQNAVRQAPGGFLRTNAITAYAAALAAQGAVSAADSVLQKEAATSLGASRRFYERTRILIALASGRRIERQTGFLRADTTLAAATVRALRFAASGDTTAARTQLASIRVVSRRDSAVLGHAPQTAEAMIAVAAKDYRRAVDLLAPAARAGEFDAALLDRADSFLMRWIVASAYEQLGRLDSAATYYDLVVQPNNVPPLHYSLRGFCYGFAHLRLAQISDRRGEHAAALRELDTVLDAFRKPDSATASVLVDARRIRARLAAPVATSPSFPQSNGAYHVSQTTRFGGNRVGRGSTLYFARL